MSEHLTSDQYCACGKGTVAFEGQRVFCRKCGKDLEPGNIEQESSNLKLCADLRMVAEQLDKPDGWGRAALSVRGAIDAIERLTRERDEKEAALRERPDDERPFNWLTDMDADFCDRHETAFRMGDGCPVCNAQGKK